jgi:hypothetical protein
VLVATLKSVGQVVGVGRSVQKREIVRQRKYLASVSVVVAGIYLQLTMGPKRKVDKIQSKGKGAKTGNSKAGSLSPKSSATRKSDTSKGMPPPVGYLISCDIPTKQFIQYLNSNKTMDNKFILEDLDAEHLLVKQTARAEIEREVERWMDENVFSAIERVGENLDMS